MSKTPPPIRRICFVTGTRAEYGLMHSALRAIRQHPALRLQLVVTGMHLDPAHGDPARVRALDPDAIVPWPAASGRSPSTNAVNTGQAIAALARTFDRLKSQIVLVVGDRVEAFAAAAAAHLSHRLLAHVHGGDRAFGQIDDSLRHAITKLAHVHFPATTQSARRIRRLGEEPWRIHCVGSPGNDGIVELAAPPSQVAEHFAALTPRRYALLLLHPADADAQAERRRAHLVLQATAAVGFERIVIVYPNNDPGCAGIIQCWRKEARGPRLTVCRDISRPLFLGLLRDAAVLVGNSSSGIIEAASFHTPVVDIGPRQAGRQHSANLLHCPYQASDIQSHLAQIWNAGRPRRARGRNVYGGGGAGQRMAELLASLQLNDRLRKKLISY